MDHVFRHIVAILLVGVGTTLIFRYFDSNNAPDRVTDEVRQGSSEWAGNDQKKENRIKSGMLQKSEVRNNDHEDDTVAATLGMQQGLSAFDAYEHWFQQLESADSSAVRRQLIQKGRMVLLNRREQLKRLIRDHPQRALAHRVSRAQRKFLPVSLQPMLELDFSGKAVFHHFYSFRASHAPGSAYTSGHTDAYYVEQDGNFYQASVYGQRLEQPTHETENLDGIRIDNRVALASGAAPEELNGYKIVDGYSGAGVPRSAYYVVRVAFPGDEQAPEASIEGLKKTMNLVADWYKKDSFGAIQGFDLTFSPTVFVDKPPAEYMDLGFHTLSTDAEAKLKQSGITPAPGTRIYYWKNRIFTGWSGMAGAQIWINGDWGFRTLAHEIGHVYGARHAKLLAVTSLDRADDFKDFSKFVEYGSPYDIMGGSSSSTASHRATSKEGFRWFPKPVRESLSKDDIDTGTTVTLYPYNNDTYDPQTTLVISFYGDSGRGYVIELSSYAGPVLYFGVSGTEWVNLRFETTDSNHIFKTSWQDRSKRNKTLTGDGLFIKVVDEELSADNREYKKMSFFVGRKENQTPTVALTADKSKISVNDVVRFVADASDGDGDTLALEWMFSDTDPNRPLGLDSSEMEHTWLDTPTGSSGVWAQVTVTDPGGLSVTKRLSLDFSNSYADVEPVDATESVAPTTRVEDVPVNDTNSVTELNLNKHENNEKTITNNEWIGAFSEVPDIDFLFSNESVMKLDHKMDIVRWFDTRHVQNELSNYASDARPTQLPGKTKRIYFDGANDWLSSVYLEPLANAKEQTYILSIKTSHDTKRLQTVFVDQRGTLMFKIFIENSELHFELKAGPNRVVLKEPITAQTTYHLYSEISFIKKRLSASVNGVKTGEQQFDFSIPEKSLRTIHLGKGL